MVLLPTCQGYVPITSEILHEWFGEVSEIFLESVLQASVLIGGGWQEMGKAQSSTSTWCKRTSVVVYTGLSCAFSFDPSPFLALIFWKKNKTKKSRKESGEGRDTAVCPWEKEKHIKDIWESLGWCTHCHSLYTSLLELCTKPKCDTVLQLPFYSQAASSTEQSYYSPERRNFTLKMMGLLIRNSKGTNTIISWQRYCR